MNCKNCETCFNICKPFSACFSEFNITRPTGVSSDVIAVTIMNAQKVSYRQQCVIVNDVISLDLALFPAGFFSAYGGPYVLEFHYPTTGQKITFIANNGLTYDCITFEFGSGQSDSNQIFINVFVKQKNMQTINLVAIALNEQQNQSDELTFLIALQNF